MSGCQENHTLEAPLLRFHRLLIGILQTARCQSKVVHRTIYCVHNNILTNNRSNSVFFIFYEDFVYFCYTLLVFLGD